MKNMKILSLFLLLASAKMYGAALANPDLGFILSYQISVEFNQQSSLDRDDVAALKLIATMSDALASDLSIKKQISDTTDRFLKRGVPLDPAQLAAQNKELQDRINTLDHNIKEFRKGGIMPTEQKKYNRRLEERREKHAALDANIADADSLTKAKGLLAQNSLVYEQALESYLASFGQCYQQDGMMIISSRYKKDQPITPKEFNQLIAVLQNGYKQFGSDIKVDLPLAKAPQVSIQDVMGYINNMPVPAQGWSYSSYAKAAGLAAAIAGAAYVGYNIYQGKDWNDTSNAANAYNAAAGGVSSAGQYFADTQVGKAALAGLDYATAQFVSGYDYVRNSKYAQQASKLAQPIIDQINEYGAQAAASAIDYGMDKKQAVVAAMDIVNQKLEQAMSDFANSSAGQYASNLSNQAMNSQAGQYASQLANQAGNNAYNTLYQGTIAQQKADALAAQQAQLDNLNQQLAAAQSAEQNAQDALTQINNKYYTQAWNKSGMLAQTSDQKAAQATFNAAQAQVNQLKDQIYALQS